MRLFVLCVSFWACLFGQSAQDKVQKPDEVISEYELNRPLVNKELITLSKQLHDFEKKVTALEKKKHTGRWQNEYADISVATTKLEKTITSLDVDIRAYDYKEKFNEIRSLQERVRKLTHRLSVLK